MYLTSVTKLKLNKQQFTVIDTMSYRAKALYNSSLYEINKHFEENGKYIGYGNLDKHMKQLVDSNERIAYRGLPAQISQQTIKKADKNFSSFFALLKKNNLMIMIEK